MKVSFDSNAWEKIFANNDSELEIRSALSAGTIEGFISEIGFRIEAVRKLDRAEYFSRPYMDVSVSIEFRDGQPFLAASIGPANARHPGLPQAQSEKLRRALVAGVKLMRGQNWMGLPGPPETDDPTLFVSEDADACAEREQRQIELSELIEARSVGKAAFDAVDGWEDRPRDSAEGKRLAKACAEWADGELVGAHIAYRHDILCTDDRAQGAGSSIFDARNRCWLEAEFGVTFMTLNDLREALARRI